MAKTRPDQTRQTSKAPAKQRDHRTAELAKIHLAKKDLGLDDDTYRDIIFVASGNKSDSAGNLDARGRHAALERFAELGWKAKPAKRAKATRRVAQNPQSKMLRAGWIQLHQAGAISDPSEAALNSFVKRMTGVDDIGWLDNRQVTVVKKALKDWLKRAEKEKKEKGGDDGEKTC